VASCLQTAGLPSSTLGALHLLYAINFSVKKREENVLKLPKDQIYKTISVCCFVWVWNLVSQHKGRLQIGVF